LYFVKTSQESKGYIQCFSLDLFYSRFKGSILKNKQVLLSKKECKKKEYYAIFLSIAGIIANIFFFCYERKKYLRKKKPLAISFFRHSKIKNHDKQ